MGFGTGAHPEKHRQPSRVGGDIHEVIPFPKKAPSRQGEKIPRNNSDLDQVLIKRTKRRLHSTGGILDPGYRANLDLLYGNDPTKKPPPDIGVLSPGYRQAVDPPLTKMKKEMTKTGVLRRWMSLVGGLIAGLGAIPPVEIHAEMMRERERQAEQSRLLEQQHRNEEALRVPAESTILLGNVMDAPVFSHLFEQTEGQPTYVGNLYSIYFGGRWNDQIAVSPDTVWIFNPTELLTRMWGYKKEMYGISDPGMVARYRAEVSAGRITRTTLNEQIRQSYGEGYAGVEFTETIANNFDWDRLAQEQNISPERLALIQEVVAQIDPMMIESVFMAELFPSANGPLNHAMMDTMLRHGGTEFFDAMPSIDNSQSAGGSQATSRWAFGPNRPVGIMGGYVQLADFSQSLPTDAFSEHIPIRTHRTVTYLIAMYNVAIASGNPAVERGFRLILSEIQAGGDRAVTARVRLAEWVGMSHNNPFAGREAMERMGNSGTIQNPLESGVDTVDDYCVRVRGNVLEFYRQYNSAGFLRRAAPSGIPIEHPDMTSAQPPSEPSN